MVANKRKGSKPESGSAFELETSDNEGLTMPDTSDRDKSPPKPAKSTDAVTNEDALDVSEAEKENQYSLKPEWIMIGVVCAMVAVLAINVKSEIATLKQSFESLSRELPLSQRGTKDAELDIIRKKIESLTQRIDKSSERHEENNNYIRELQSALNGVKETIKDMSNKAEVHRHELTSEIQKISAKLVTKEELRGKFTDFKEENIDPMSLQIGDLNGQLKIARDKHATDYTALSNEHSNMVNTMDKHKAEMDGLSSAIESYQADIQNKAEELNAKLETADEELKKFESKMSNMTQKLDIHDEDLDTAFSNLFNKEAATIVIVLMLSMNFGLVVAVYILCQGRSNRGNLPRHVTKNGPQDTYYNPVLDRIPANPVLQKAVGVISFSGHYQDVHRDLVRSVTATLQRHVEVQYHVILNDQDIVAIPHCTVILIFVEYSSRDVIIEESGYGLGDCNKTTLMAVQQIGGQFSKQRPVVCECARVLNMRGRFHVEIPRETVGA